MKKPRLCMFRPLGGKEEHLGLRCRLPGWFGPVVVIRDKIGYVACDEATGRGLGGALIAFETPGSPRQALRTAAIYVRRYRARYGAEWVRGAWEEMVRRRKETAS